MVFGMVEQARLANHTKTQVSHTKKRGSSMPKRILPMTDRELRKRLRSLEQSGKRETFSVGGVSGLCVAWSSPTNAQWVMRLRAGGKEKPVSMGSVYAMSLQEAREKALAVKECGGRLPEEATAVVAEERRTDSVAKLWPKWIDAQRARNKWKSEDDYRHAMQRGEKYVYPCIGGKHVGEVTAQDVGAVCLYTSERVGKASVEKILQCLRMFFRWCSAEGLIDRDKRLPTDRDLIREYLPVIRAVKHSHYAMCPVAELPDLVAELVEPRRFGNVGAMALLFAILTNSRLANVCNSHEAKNNYAVWEEIDKEAAVWTIPAHKMKVPGNGNHVVPLSKAALRILERLEKLGRRSAGAVFKGAYGSPLSDGVFRKIIRTINQEREARGEKPFIDAESGKAITQHGTARATFRTWAADNGEDRDAVEKALHHVADTKLGRAYDRSNALEARRGIADRWAEHCLSKCPTDWYEGKGA